MNGLKSDKDGMVDLEEFVKVKNRIASRYHMADVHAGCYVCNYRDQYLCRGCTGLDKCEQVYSAESEET